MSIKSKKIIRKNNQKMFKIISITAISMVVIVTGLCIGIVVNNNIRKDRISSIFSSLKLDEQKYEITQESIFGNKQIYSWDSSRSYSSARYYIRGANVDETVAELKQAVAGTDFTFYEEPYPGSADFMYIYKSPRNEYLRISVSSKTRTDDF